MLARAFFVFLICQACRAECIQVKELQSGTIRVTAFDLHGGDIQSIQAELSDHDNPETHYTSLEGRFERILYGAYQLRIRSAGFYEVEVPIRLDQPVLHVRVQLPVGREYREFSSVVGTVSGEKPARNLWVKVIPIHGSGGVEVPVSRAGYFLASGLNEGQYLLIVMEDAALIQTKTLFVLGETKVSLNLPDARANRVR